VGALWFIHMLPVFFVVTRLLRRVPPWVMWLCAATLHSLQIQSDWHIIRELAARYVYFYSGYVLAPHVFRLAAWSRARWSRALGYAGAAAVIFAAASLSKLPWTAPLRYLGQHSIVVYMGDFAVSMLGVIALTPLVGELGSRALIATALTVIGTVVAWRVARGTPLGFLYERPRWLWL
jgi:uncharacterized membrane protein YcfT